MAKVTPKKEYTKAMPRQRLSVEPIAEGNVAVGSSSLSVLPTVPRDDR